MAKQTVSWQYKLGALSAICILSLASSCGSIFGDFVFDDSEAIVNNQDVRPTTPLKNIFLNDFWGTRLTHSQSHKSYRPLTILTFRINYWIFDGLVPWSFHVVNVILHCIVSCLLWFVYMSMIGGEKYDTCLWATFLFASHPIHTEAVSGIVGRADLLSALFFLLSFLCYAYSAHITSSTSKCWTFVSLFLTCLAVFSKEYGITVLAFNFVYEILAVQKVDARKWLKIRYWNWRSYRAFPKMRCAILIFASFTIIYLRCYLMDFGTPVFQKVDNPASFQENWFLRVLSLQYIVCLNLWLLICPDWLCFDWSMGCVPLIQNIFDSRLLFSFICWSILAALLVTALRSNNLNAQREILLSLALLAVPFLPATNLLFRVGFVVAERVLYLPSAGFCLIVALGLEKLFTKKDVTFAFIFLIMVFLIKSHVRNLDWRSEVPLFKSALKVCPTNAKVRYNIAKAAADRGFTEKAIAEYREAIQLYPEYDQALNNLANLLKSRGDFVEAEKLLRRALKVRPEFPAAWMNLGIVLAASHRHAEAEKCYMTALRMRKVYPDCLYNLGNLYLDQHRYTEAENAWLQATQLKPAMTIAWNNLIMLKDNQGNHTAAIAVADTAMMLAGEAPSFHFNKANALGKLGLFEEAEKHFLKAISQEKDNALYHVNLGVLYHRWKKYDSAEKEYLIAMKLNPKLSSAKQNYELLKKKTAEA